MTEVFPLEPALKRKIGEDWLENLRTQEQTRHQFKSIGKDGVCRYCVIGALLDACVSNGLGSWKCEAPTSDAISASPSLDKVNQLCFFKLDDYASTWQSASMVMIEFGLVPLKNILNQMVLDQYKVELIQDNDVYSKSFEELFPRVLSIVNAIPA